MTSWFSEVVLTRQGPLCWLHPWLSPRSPSAAAGMQGAVLGCTLHPQLKEMEAPRPAARAPSGAEAASLGLGPAPPCRVTSQVRTKPGVFLFFTKQTFVSQKPAPSSSLSTYVRAGGGARSYSSPLTARTLANPAWQCPRVSRRPVFSLPAESCPQRGCESSGGAPTACLHEALEGRSESRGQPRHRPMTKLGASPSSSVPDASSEPLDGCSWVSLDPAITWHLDQRYTHPLGE